MSLDVFQDNAAHSVRQQALKVTDYHPSRQASIVGFRSYLNKNGLLNISTSDNLSMLDAILEKAVHEPYPITIRNMTVVKFRGCNDVAGLFEDEEIHSLGDDMVPVSSNDDHVPTGKAAPRAPSVFYLQETHEAH
jgi:hypothetical protein